MTPQQKIIDYVRDQSEPVSSAQVRDALDMNQSTCGQYLSALFKSGELDRIALGYNDFLYKPSGKKKEPTPFATILPWEWGPPGKPYEPEKRRRS